MGTIRITAQVLNGATSEVREVTANVAATSEQDAVNKLFAKARKDDYYYRFLGMHGIITPTIAGAVPVEHQTLKYWALEPSLESPCAGCGKSPQECICREPKIQALIDCARDVINNWESGDLAAAVTELQFALNDLGYTSEVPRG